MLQEAIQDQEVELGNPINLVLIDAGNDRVTYADVDGLNDIPAQGKGRLQDLAAHRPDR